MTNFVNRSGEGGWGAARADLRWSVDRQQGSPADLLAAGIPADAGRLLRWCVPTSVALVLGSAQRGERGQVIRRRSGGAAVLVAPGRLLWADVIVPRADPLWVEDVGRSALWLGAVWAVALTDVGVGGATVYRGPIQRSATVCFAGIAPGEVVVAGRKLVGISQRRTRFAALYQCAVLRVTEPDETAAVGLDELADAAVEFPIIERAFERQLALV